MTPREFMAGAIKVHEGELSMQQADNGNWFDKARYAAGLRQERGKGRLVGSKFGVTAYALAAYRHDSDIEPWEMASRGFDEAVDIAVHLYVKAPRLDMLPSDRIVLSIIDKGWGSGPGQAIKLVQRMVGTADDGKMGPGTAAAYRAWRAARTEESGARDWAAQRHAFDKKIATNEGPSDPDRIFLKGWDSRTDSFLPGTKWWSLAA